MLENGLQRMIMLACGVVVFGVMWIFLFGSVGEDDPSEGYVDETTTQVLEQSQKRSHKY